MGYPLPRTSLYVGDLHPDVTEEDLSKTFGQVGPLASLRLCRDKLSHKSLCHAFVNFWLPGHVLSCKVAEEDGISKGFGFVQFDSEDTAMAALNALHDTVLEGKKLYVSKFVRKIWRQDGEPGFRSLYVKNLDECITEDVLKDKFSEHGKVSSAVIMKDEKGTSKGFGFVNFDSHESAKKAMEALNGELVGSKNLFVGKALKKAERKEQPRQHYGCEGTDHHKKSNDSTLYVRNLDRSIDDRKLEQLFSHFGTVVSAKVIRNSDGVSKGFGFPLATLGWCRQDSFGYRASDVASDQVGYLTMHTEKAVQLLTRGKIGVVSDNFEVLKDQLFSVACTTDACNCILYASSNT
ncbi:UNVERIFIED_CONTAM: Polyadenylate-binding protein 6 [Sesamum radiatum]|uniref:Polyadenylate-binding protein 6 n=1 Tax=Sesamum radiatum TaxID=300843 RepID=A0AAW2WHY5_SESRA